LGFTLIELLVVIAIVVILAGLVFPALMRAKHRAQAVSCLNSVKQLTMASLLYSDDFQQKLPYNLGSAEIREMVARNWYWNWTSPVMSWEREPDNTNAPALTRGGIGPYTSRSASLYRCPSDQVVSDWQAEIGWTRRVRSMSMNAMVGNAGEYSKSGANVNNPEYRQFFKLSQITQPARIFVFTEEHPDSINDGYFLNFLGTGKWTDLPASYHSGAANLSFADGHAETHKWIHASTKPAARPEAAGLPFAVPAHERADFDWLMARTSRSEYQESTSGTGGGNPQ
jgi:prepilin-type N-terminal cleavage/methylation domain-containing protein/prepilin-type processing-associated H-X9-DG protein